MPLDPADFKSIIDNINSHLPDTKGARKHDREGALRVIAALERIPHALDPAAGRAAPEGVEDPDDRAIARTVAAIDDSLAKIKADDLTAVESMLAGQAAALEVLFNEYAKRAARTDYHAPIHMCLGFALRAQAQCRVTVQSLAQLKDRRRACRTAETAKAGAAPASAESSGFCIPSNEQMKIENTPLDQSLAEGAQPAEIPLL